MIVALPIGRRMLSESLLAIASGPQSSRVTHRHLLEGCMAGLAETRVKLWRTLFRGSKSNKSGNLEKDFYRTYESSGKLYPINSRVNRQLSKPWQQKQRWNRARKVGSVICFFISESNVRCRPKREQLPTSIVEVAR